MKISGVFLLLALALFCFFSGVFSQGEQDKRAGITRSEGRLPGKSGLRWRLFQLPHCCVRPTVERTPHCAVDCGEFQDAQVFCTRESNPFCGSDGQTYGNKCAFCKAMVKSGGKINLKHHGKC